MGKYASQRVAGSKAEAEIRNRGSLERIYKGLFGLGFDGARMCGIASASIHASHCPELVRGFVAIKYSF